MHSEHSWDWVPFCLEADLAVPSEDTARLPAQQEQVRSQTIAFISKHCNSLGVTA